MSGHASGQLCRLRLTVPTAPGADPSQVGVLRFHQPRQMSPSFMHCSTGNEFKIMQYSKALSFCMHLSACWHAPQQTQEAGPQIPALRMWLMMQLRSACGQVELAGGDDFAGTHLVPWLTLHAGPVADLALNADTHEAWALHPLTCSPDQTCLSHACLVTWQLHVPSGGRAGRPTAYSRYGGWPGSSRSAACACRW